MDKVIDHIIQESLLEFLNYRTQIDLKAYHNATGELYRYIDPRTKLVAYGAPEAGWVYNKVPNRIRPIISGFTPGISGFIGPDYVNGRFMFSGNFTAPTLTGSYTVAEVNYYLTSSTESKLLFETKYQQTPVLNAADSYIEPYNFITPCVFVKSYQTQNEPYCLGGDNCSVFNFKIVALMENEYQLAGIQKIIRDAYQCVFPLLNGGVINQFGGAWDLTWDYQYFAENNPYRGYISDSTFQIEEADVFTAANPKLF